jgi:hypothetical protein
MTNTSGSVTPIIDGTAFVVLEDVLIVEFAAFTNRWLEAVRDGQQMDFCYRSMDEEEEPLLAFDIQHDGTYVARSCWYSAPIRPIKRDEIIDAFSNFLRSFKSQLAEKYNFNVDSAFEMLP